MQFKTKILQFGNNTGIEIPEDMLEKLGGGKRPLVKVTINDYTYRCAVGKMGDKYLISLSAENRTKSKTKGGDEVDVIIELDIEPRIVELPSDFEHILDQNPVAKSIFEKLAPSKKKAMVHSILDAKTEETRQNRIEKSVNMLLNG